MSRTSRFPNAARCIAFAALAAVVPAHAAPLLCGTTVTSSVTLTADLVCLPGFDGLVIGADNVRIDLNGFTISGPYTTANPFGLATGVSSLGFENVQIVGPGRISGFYYSVDVDGGYNHLISGIDAISDSFYSVALRNSSGSTVEGNQISTLELTSDPGFKTNSNKIVGNNVHPGGARGGQIIVAGCETADNMVANNSISPDDWVPAVILYDGANANQIVKNKIMGGKVLLWGVSNNMIAGNSFRLNPLVSAGVDLQANATPCAGGAILPSSGNIVRGNQIRDGQFGVSIDGRQGASSSRNVITGNTFTSQVYAGMSFGAWSDNNDGRGNTYVNISNVPFDIGTGNLWP